jgi:hypothetical protein
MSLPAEMKVTPEPAGIAETGVYLSIFVPSPNCPTLFLPQHLTPPATIAQPWLVPKLTEVTSEPARITQVGVLFGVDQPQHLTPP